MTDFFNENSFEVGDWVILAKAYENILLNDLNEKDLHPIEVVSIEYINTQVGPTQFEKKRSVSTNDRGDTYTIKCAKYRLATESEIKKEQLKRLFTHS